MAKEYDPILCMMVDKATKAQDANKYVEQAIKWMKEGKDRLYILFGLQQMGLTSGDAAKYYAEAMTETGYKYRQKDAKANDKLVKVPDNKLKEFEGILRSAGFKIISKSDRGSTTHYQVEVDSPNKFSTEAELREWAKKIDAACDKMDATAPTTWNIGLTTNGKITAGLDVREMYVKDSASVLDTAVSTCDEENEKWITVNGSHIKIDGQGNPVAGNPKVVAAMKGKREGSGNKNKQENSTTVTKHKVEVKSSGIHVNGKKLSGSALPNMIYGNDPRTDKEQGYSDTHGEVFYGGIASQIRNEGYDPDKIRSKIRESASKFHGNSNVNEDLMTNEAIQAIAKESLNRAIKWAKQDRKKNEKFGWNDPSSKYHHHHVNTEKEIEELQSALNEMKGSSKDYLPRAIKICDASTGRKVVVFAENYLRSLGKNNGVGKYDKIVQGVRSILGQSLLEDDKLEKAVQREVDRLLKKYNL